MDPQQLKIGNGYLNTPQGGVSGGFVTLDDERFYRISNYDLMPDFFMTIVSDSDHWMFLSSNGALSAGRRDRDNAIFPYYTVDKIHDFHGITGSRTLVRCRLGDDVFLWEPFSKPHRSLYNLERQLSKSVYGNKVVFTEINHDLGLTFEYGWYNSERFGWIKQSRITNTAEATVDVSVVDGLGNILPSEVEYQFQNEYSNLLDGYKKNELLTDSALGVFFLSAIPIDRAEPSESLRATTVWSLGADADALLLGDEQFDAFRRGGPVSTECDKKGKRAGYYRAVSENLASGDSCAWLFAAELNQTSTDVANLQHWLLSAEDKAEQIGDDIAQGTERLRAIVASADGIQASAEELTVARHFSNTLFNVMRGGVFRNGYQIDREDFLGFVATTNSTSYAQFESQLSELPKQFDVGQLHDLCAQAQDAHLTRICSEYLPLTFSRRHGDPSRPWNLFSIVTKNEDGTPVSDYQGNWRDIFQNWEALSISYPGFIRNIIEKFFNASTADGYNPYRIMKSGMDWEKPDPEDPWAYIGYWGDHQIIYLQKLLEVSEQFYPGALEQLLEQDVFAYANVPYRIKSYEDILRDPQETIDFDGERDAAIEALVAEIGADGRLIQSAGGGVYHVNMAEKVLVTLLAKLSNFVPEAGIWMTTQRPEWNDANNALVGNGASVVTTCYLRRFLAFWSDKFGAMGDRHFEVSTEVADLLASIAETLVAFEARVASGFDDVSRRQITDALGTAGAHYRERIYQGFSGNRRSCSAADLAAFCARALRYTEQTIAANAREDGLYHAYNLVGIAEGSLTIRHLYEMLEGQVAALSAGCLTPEQSERVLHAMKDSGLYRENQYTYMLYPDRELRRFTDKNTLPAAAVERSSLIDALLTAGDTSIVERDGLGGVHFNSEFHNASYLTEALDALCADTYGALVLAEREQLLADYESIFDHQSFTGRSGTFYAYEGLGCVYWHMVSKLLLAVSETIVRGFETEADPGVCNRLKEHYFEIKAGIGLFKSPDLYGAFPTDAYSHTSRDAGVKQPGMTGQVKEDVLSRFAEVGLRVRSGQICFDTRLMNPGELLASPAAFEFFDVEGHRQSLSLDSGQLAFSLCQVPVVYSKAEQPGVALTLASGETRRFDGHQIDSDSSQAVFGRDGQVKRIDVNIVV